MYIFDLSFLALTALKILAIAMAMPAFFALLGTKNTNSKFEHLLLPRS